MSDDQYLVAPGQESDIDVALRGGESSPQPGRLFSLNSEEATIQFGADHDVRYHLGQSVTVSLSSERLGDQIVIPGTVQSRREEGSRRLFQVPFVLQGSEGSQLQRRLGKLNRRKETRVTPEEADEVRVSVRQIGLNSDGQLVSPSGCEQNIPLQLQDLSFHGISLTAPLQTDQALADTQLLELRLTFPEPLPEAVVVGFIRNRVLEGECVRYGVEVMALHTEDWMVHEDTIAQYVWQRMRVLLGG